MKLKQLRYRFEIIPTDKAVKITQDDYDELLDNFDNVALWKEKFPINSYIFKGFVISNIFDVTDDQSISQLKSSLIGEDKRQNKNFMKEFQEVFRSLFGFNDLNVGFSVFQADQKKFEKVHGIGINSYLLNNEDLVECSDALCDWSYNRLLNEQKYYTVSNVKKAHKQQKGKAPHITALYKQGVGSAIFAPIANEDGLMGILELVSEKPKVLNSVNANKLIDVMPFIVSAVEQSKKVEENLIEAIIQQECTSIHASVYWKFVEAARRFLKEKNSIGSKATFESIIFDNIYHLNLIYYYRKNYDDSIMLINKNMAALLDEKQKDAQAMYPHYFERYKTDGVEHNMFVLGWMKSNLMLMALTMQDTKL